ncbi:arylsulfatase A-like enzyme [Caulobacter ginsengisoli]|uniref:Arylsulfatase A-like enzyme n=1 Tax=Caulobacter ginsengisoli TaxID=400775 RepID=A0ABU0ISP6_9CAUL|nr:sulfatase-like hydrolase/transferase [Caulobacter ginsengisoli]MDQ0464188.1 arylsulfatase A-like enzyme [Caulobacter ginsengisoli]
MSDRPNILLITCDQFQFSRFAYGPDHGFVEDLKDVLGFQALKPGNTYEQYFPGLKMLRDGPTVVLRNHTIAASACTPSRAAIYTGQYGTKTGVTQTDGLFKSGDDYDFPWLEADGIPTLGTWLREAGYSTHYFGKWHVSDPPGHSLDRFGFDDWELSYPEPHGAAINNLGIYRDVGFADAACAFLRRQGLAVNYNRQVAMVQKHDPYSSGPDPEKSVRPWFAVASFTNPHDIATYPAVIGQALPKPDDSGPQGVMGPLTVPLQTQATPPPTGGKMSVPLNPAAFPQNNAAATPTQDEDLSTKPSCQFDYSYKVALALNAKTGFNGVLGMDPPPPTEAAATAAAVAIALQSSIPFQLYSNPAKGGTPASSALDFLQLYAWLHYAVDRHIAEVLTALESSGQADNTIVIFLADHGEYAGAHGMMIEKWHTAYQEALHVPVVIRFPKSAGQPRTGEDPVQIDALTSHIDILPTVLGLAGLTQTDRETISARMAARRPVPPLPGVDLTPLITGQTDVVIEPDGQPRKGVLFITDDEITAPLPPTRSPQDQKSMAEFEVFKAIVETVKHGTPGTPAVPGLAPGAVRQPNHVRSVRTLDYKLSRYFDPSGQEPQEWECYDLRNDAIEAVNLVQVNVSPPTIRTDLPITDPGQLQQTVDQLAELLALLEKRDL